MSLQDLVDGRFGGTSPDWALIGAGSPQVGCHEPEIGSSQSLKISFGGKIRDF
jgi:hypothetical protein